MKKFDQEGAFRAAGAAASAVLRHRSTDPEVATARWSFNRGDVSMDGETRAWAEFSRVPFSGGLLHDFLAIIAVKTESGHWVVQHALTRSRR